MIEAAKDKQERGADNRHLSSYRPCPLCILSSKADRELLVLLRLESVLSSVTAPKNTSKPLPAFMDSLCPVPEITNFGT
jgi:hypothetical protein